MHAFARLRFNDGNYYMHTYSIILGRNVELAREDILNLKRAKRAIESANADGLDQRKKRKRRNHRPRSVVSNTGGIVNISAAALPAEYQQRRPSVASNSHDSSSNRNPASNPDDVAEQAPQDILMEALDPLPTQLGTRTPQDPHECPIVPIHPQNIRHMTNIQGPKGISRKHAKIAYNFDERYFELEVFSRNGLYHEDVFYSAGHKIRLNHGDTIVIGAVDMTFTLPDEALTEEDRARNNRSSRGSESRPMSFAFENGNGELEDANMDDEDSLSEGTSVNPRHIFQFTEDFDSDVDHLAGDDDGMDEDEEEDLEEEEEQKLKVKLKLKSKHIPPPPRKEVKAPQKRKHVREPSPVEPPFKRPKKKIPEPEQEPVKEKEKLSSKIPAKAPVKSPIKDVPRDPTPEKPEPEKTPTSQSPTLTKKTIPEGAASMEDGEQGGIITAELAKLHGLPPSLIGQVLEKRKGPGRPPKDGLISKRQKALLVKEGKRIEQARKEGRDVDALPALPIKPKIARPRKESTSNPGEGDDDDIRESTEAGDGAAGMGDKKPSKPNKPPRTPSPELRIEDYTEEQLQRPSANYVVLIHEAISSSNTGQMNLQQIYTYIEKKYPWYKFKTTTSGWQSSVRHNLGQHDAFVKGDKEGKGYNWKINPDVSIEKERRKRQVSPTVSHSQRPGYYPQHTGYPAYGQPPTPYYSGIPPQSIQGVANGLPRPPPSVEQPRLPPSLQRNSTAGAAPAAQTAPNPSPYSSPWAGGNPAGSPVNQNPPRPYPPSHVQTPPVSSTTTSTGQYGVLMPTTGSQGGTTTSGSYQSQYATAGASPYASGPTRTYSPYATAGSPSSTLPHVPTVPRPTSNASTHNPPHHPSNTSIPRVSHPSGRYPVGTDPLIIAQLEGFRQYYLEQTELDRDLETVKVDNAYKALFNPAFVSKLTKQEADLLDSISGFVSKIPVGNTSPQEGAEAMKKAAMSTNLASTAAAIAAHNAAAAASNETKEIPNVPLAKLETSSSKPGTSAISPGMEPHKFTPSMVNPAVSFVANGPMAVASSPIGTRPSVEPLTPVPGSPAVGIVPLMKQALAIPSERDLEDAKAGAAEPSTSKPEASVPSARPNETPAPKTE
ncbi:hypothetical protein B0J11DRAFT_430451 [Dendryphion nanum]|uniref:Uncharacterized protein n=1 Tax=Dendryphion nanum TaxID=256645 RepID=A0A9P9E4F3_9PLEO|nr:hypothetical protein B0J11DRAFT_430451 [Dendryphion nanum]